MTPGFEDGELNSIMARGLLTARERPISNGHTELAARTLLELYPGGLPKSSYVRPSDPPGERTHYFGSAATRYSGLQRNPDTTTSSF